jgi:hypothetical protein
MKKINMLLVLCMSLSIIACGKKKDDEQQHVTVVANDPALQYYCTTERIMSIGPCYVGGWCDVQLSNGLFARRQFPRVGEMVQWCPTR